MATEKKGSRKGAACLTGIPSLEAAQLEAKKEIGPVKSDWRNPLEILTVYRKNHHERRPQSKNEVMKVLMHLSHS